MEEVAEPRRIIGIVALTEVLTGFSDPWFEVCRIRRSDTPRRAVRGARYGGGRGWFCTSQRLVPRQGRFEAAVEELGGGRLDDEDGGEGTQ